MATIDYRAAYELLRRVMEQQDLERQAADSGSKSGAASGPGSAYGSPQGGLLGRLTEFQEQQPNFGGAGWTPFEPQDPNFRRLTRVPVIAQSQGETSYSDGASDQSSSPYFPSGATAFDWLRNVGAPGSMPALPWGVRSPVTFPLRFPGRGIPIPVPPTGPGSTPPIPMPAIPEWWKTVGQIMQMYPRMFLEGGGGGGDDEDCKKEIREARKICTDAFADNWKSDYDVGPYEKLSGEPWSIQDCMRGLISERCGGNPVERDLDKNGRKKR